MNRAPLTSRTPRVQLSAHPRSLFRTALLVLWTALLPACGPTVNDICSALDDRSCTQFNSEEKCRDSGHALESQADSAGCDVQFDDYLHCLDESKTCNWTTDCAHEKTSLDTCLSANTP